MNFDYNRLDAETRITVKQRETELDELARNTADNMREMGFKLVDIRSALLYKKPGFVAWYTAKGLPTSTVYRLINLAIKPKKFASAGNILTIASLSEPQTPDEARIQIEDATGSEEIIEAVETGVITNRSMAMAATNDPDPDTILVNAAGEVARELVASGYVSSKNGDQVQPTSATVIPAIHAAMSERNARKGQHMDDSKANKVTLPTDNIEEAARRILDSFQPQQITELLTILSSAVAERAI